MRELSKSIARRLREPNFMRRYFVGRGVDIGGRPDPLLLYKDLFPLISDVQIWDLEDGDAQFMRNAVDNYYDFVTSSHCLEHLQDPVEGLKNWLRIVRPGGYIVVLLPDEDLYEQDVFPSTYNGDHKHTFTVGKQTSWSEHSINVLDLVQAIGAEARVEKIELLNATFRDTLPRYDQTMTPISESAIEFIIRKADPEEVKTGRRTRNVVQPDPVLRRYYNQYRLDYEAMKAGGATQPPFKDEREL